MSGGFREIQVLLKEFQEVLLLGGGFREFQGYSGAFEGVSGSFNGCQGVSE